MNKVNNNEQETSKPFDLKEKERFAVKHYENEEIFESLAEEFCNAKIVNGTAQDFINFSISFKQNNDNKTACKILRRGLDFYINDVELLACYLTNAIDSGIKEEIDYCEGFYEKIKSNPLESYSEYAFNSVLKYLMTKKTLNSEFVKIKSETKDVLNVFSKQYPNSESVYLANYEFISEFDANKERGEAKLKEAVIKLDSCPRCALRLADILCEKANYKEAQRIIVKKCLISEQILPNHSKAFVYYLLGVCELGMFQKWSLAKRNCFLNILKKRNDKNIELKVQRIYKSFEIAKSEYLDLKYAHKKEIEKKIYILEQQTGIVYS